MRVGIAGLGLIGGSLALALKDTHAVRGYDLDPAARETAAARGIEVVPRLDGLAPADAILVATPLLEVVPTLEALAGRSDGAVLMETASLKAGVAAFAERSPDGLRLVGIHPMAGSTRSGPEAADPEMFRGRPFLVVPTARSDEAALALAGELGRALGSVPTVCSVQAHDDLVSAVSALPLAAAGALALAATEAAGAGLSLAGLGGPGLRDTTRLAATPLALALPLLRQAPRLSEHLERLVGTLREIEAALEDEEALREVLLRAREARLALEQV